MKPFFIDFLGHTLHSKVQNVPVRSLIILGQAPLMGPLTGYLALELGPEHTVSGARLWTLCEQEPSDVPILDNTTNGKRPYGRICSDAPCDDTEDTITKLMFWINPKDRLTQAAGLGSEWLIPTQSAARKGLIHAQINTLMLPADVISTLGIIPSNTEPSPIAVPLAH